VRRQGELLYAVEWKQFARVLAQWCEIGVDVEKDIYWKALRMVLVPGTHPAIELAPPMLWGGGRGLKLLSSPHCSEVVR
jgi:hypothetical protein